MFYYIISTTCLKIGDLFCPIHIYGLSHSVHSKTIHHVNLALLDHHHDLLDYSHLRTYWIIELENDVCNKFACENAQIMVCSRVRPRMLTFLLRIYYAFIIKMLPFEVFRQKLGISFKGGIQQLRRPNFTQFWPPTPQLLEWTKMDILDTIPYVTWLTVDFPMTPLSPLLVHVAIEWPLMAFDGPRPPISNYVFFSFWDT